MSDVKQRRADAMQWTSESAMFSAFIQQARHLGFVCFSESCGHDLILQAGPNLADCRETAGLEPGDTIVVEGKLRAGLGVLCQALPPRRRVFGGDGPCANWYAVLVPKASSEFTEVAGAAGVVVLQLEPGENAWRFWGWDENLRSEVLAPLDLPPVVEMPAGLPSPRSITRWKVAAVRLCLEAVEHPNREIPGAAFRRGGVRQQLFLDRGWARVARREGRGNVYELLDGRDDRPDLKYPEITEAVLREGFCATKL